jgi:tetraacyldisaccharide 4'-kinase
MAPTLPSIANSSPKRKCFRMRWLERQWQHPTLAGLTLIPLSMLYRGIVAIRRHAYRRGWFSSVRLPVPVIIVGNITVGGTGKTPLVIWLARRLRALGWRPGIVTRGYRGKARDWPQTVVPGSDPDLVGDEPVLLARNADVPVVADPDRVRAARAAVDQGCDILVSDDGLQHYRLARTIEICVIDGVQRFGNGRLLPAGPLREPAARAQTVDVRLVRETANPDEWKFALRPSELCRVKRPSETASIGEFQGQTVHAVAGIGHPARFFDALRMLGLAVVEHPFPDHHRFAPSDLEFPGSTVVIMTEKDAVKCADFADERAWFLAVDVEVDDRFDRWLQQRLRELRRG